IHVLPEVVKFVCECHRETDFLTTGAAVQIGNMLKPWFKVFNGQIGINQLVYIAGPTLQSPAPHGPIQTPIRIAESLLEPIPILIIEKAQQSRLGKRTSEFLHHSTRRRLPLCFDGSITGFNLYCRRHSSSSSFGPQSLGDWTFANGNARAS